MNSKEWWRWCIFNLFVDSVLYVIDLQRISLRRSFVSYKISSVTFGSPLEKDIVSWSKRNKSTLLAFRLSILQAILSSCVCERVCAIFILAMVVTRIWIFSGKLCSFFALSRKFSIFCSSFVSNSHVHVFYFFHSHFSISVFTLPPYVREWIYFTALAANSGHLTIFVHSLEHILWINYK